MFEPHFGLRENPFSTSHDPRFVYPSPEHLEAVAHFRYGIQNREAFVLVTGEVGTGKTTAIYDLVSRLPQQTHIALINNSALTRLELLEEIARRFGLDMPASQSKPALLTALELRLSAHVNHGEPCILIVDEAQNLTHDLLEEIRLLSNLEDRGGHLLHICLVGQPELEEKLARPELRQLRQRISVKYRLKPLTLDETVRYLHHRLRVAGGDSEALFPAESSEAVHRMTHGIPREINIVAGQSMVNAFVDGARGVSPNHVRAVSDEFAFQSVLSLDPRPVTGPGEIPLVPPIPTAPPMVAYPNVSMPSSQPRPPVAPAQPMPPATPGDPVQPAGVRATPAVAPPAPGTVTQSVPSPVTLAPPVAPAPVATESSRTVSNWRETRMRVPSAPLDQVEVTAKSELEMEELRARRLQLVALATLLAVILIGGVVAFSTGLGDRIWSGTSHAERNEKPGAAPGNEAPSGVQVEPGTTEGSAGNAVTDSAASVSSPIPAESDAPSGTSTARATSPPPIRSIGRPYPGAKFGLQVASFRTASRATRAMHDLATTANLPGEVMAGENVDGETWFRVVLGRFPDESQARNTADELLKQSIIAEALVIPYTPRQP